MNDKDKEQLDKFIKNNLSLTILVFLALITLWVVFNFVIAPGVFYLIGNFFFTAPFYAYQLAWIVVKILKALWG